MAKKPLKAIREHVTQPASALAVYVALCEIASDRGHGQFQASHAEIMLKSGIKSDRTVRDRLADMAQLGVISVQENRISNRLRAPSTYTLLSFGNDCRSFGKENHSSLPRVEKNSYEKKKKKVHGESPIPAGYSEGAETTIAIWHEVACASGLGFLPVTQYSEEIDCLCEGNDPLEVRELFQWCVDRERENPTQLSKTLRRVLECRPGGEGLVEGFYDQGFYYPPL